MTKFGKHMRIDLGMVPSYLKTIDLPTQGGRSGNFKGSTNQKSRKCHELSRKSIHVLTHPTPGVPGGLGVNISKVREIS